VIMEGWGVRDAWKETDIIKTTFCKMLLWVFRRTASDSLSSEQGKG
jgi:hypothetical protein